MQDVARFAMALPPGLPVLLGLATAFLLGAAAGYLLRLWQGAGASSDSGSIPGRSSSADSPATGDPSRARRRSVGDPDHSPFGSFADPAAPPILGSARDGGQAGREHDGQKSGGRRRGSKRRDARTVLVADDRPELLALHGAYLEQHGYRVLTATDGNAALALARSERPAVIVLDHSMPGRSGIEVTRELKADPRTAEIPVLLMTAHSYGAVGANARAAGVASFMTKPCDPSRVLREVAAFAAPGAGVGA